MKCAVLIALLCIVLICPGSAGATTLSGSVDNLTGPAKPDLFSRLNNAVDGKEDPKAVLKDLKNVKTANRWIGATRRQVVIAYCFFYDPPAGKNVVASFEEKERNTLFADQFKKLVEVGQNVGGAAAATKPIRINSTKYVLEDVRANLTVTAKIQDKPSEATEVTGDPTWFVVLDLTNGGQADDNKDSDSVAVSTGPREPWSISADLPVTHASELKINDQTHEIESKEQPGFFYAGFDYAPWGDVLGPASQFTDSFVLKFLAKVSKKPLDSFGLGVALRPGFYSHILPSLNIFDTFSPFVAVTWTRQDKKLPSGELKVNGSRLPDFRVGLSFNIDKAVDWTKKNDTAKQK